jgi:hypothetical protein
MRYEVANHFVELTRVDAGLPGVAVVVNLNNVAWIESSDDGTTRIVFAVGLPRERANGSPLSLLVRESMEEIGLLTGVLRKTDRDAIAQAWVDQTARRGFPDENG